MTETKNISTISEGIQRETYGLKKKKRKKFSCNQKLALITLISVDFMNFCSMSIMAPFYPQEAAKKGMSASMAGFVFGFYALIIFLSSPLFGKILPSVGVRYLFTGGALISGTCHVIFGTLHRVENANSFMFLSFLIRGLEALGSSAYNTASYVAIVNIFPENVGTIRGLLETFVGLGLSVGPALGGLLFTIGGFGLPFYVVGLLILTMAPLGVCFLPQSASAKPEKSSFLNLLKIHSVLVTSLVVIVVSMTWSFLDPTLEPHLKKFNLSPGNIGLLFLLLSAMYGIFSPAWGWLTDKLSNYWILMVIGLFLNFFSLLFLGPSTLLHTFLKDSIWLNIFALSTLGISVAMALMPTYQAILDDALEGGFEDNLGTQGVIAGLWSCVYSLGEVIGPVLGGVLMQYFNFSVTTTVFALLNFTMATLALFYFYFRRKKGSFSLVLPSNALYFSSKNTDFLNHTFK